MLTVIFFKSEILKFKMLAVIFSKFEILKFKMVAVIFSKHEFFFKKNQNQNLKYWRFFQSLNLNLLLKN
jgi:hypothetical protein